MRAVDTNIVIRFLLADDEKQAAIAEEIFSSPWILTLTVLLEAIWVLASRYKLVRGDVVRLVRNVLELDTVNCEELPTIEWALDRYLQGADIADMIHLIAARNADQFTTFDRRLAKRAGSKSPVTIQTIR